MAESATRPRRRRRLVLIPVALLALAGCYYGFRLWQAKQPPEHPPRAWKKEIARWEGVAESEPQNERAWARLGQLYGMTGRFDDATTAGEKALAARPDDLAGWDRLGRAYANGGRFEDAIRCYERVLGLVAERGPSAEVPVRQELSALCLELGKAEEALTHAKAAVEAAESVRDQRKAWLQYEQVAICYWAAGQRDEAKDWLAKAAGGGSELAGQYVAQIEAGDAPPEECTHQVSSRRLVSEETLRYEGRAELPPYPPPPPWESGPTTTR